MQPDQFRNTLSTLGQWVRLNILLVVLGCLSFALMAPVGLSGDEFYYFSLAKRIALKLGSSSELNSVDYWGRGFFVPGTSFLLQPIVLLHPDPPIYAIRFYALIINRCLLSAISSRVRQRVGVGRCYLFHGILLFSPYYVAHIATIWSEMFALHAVVLLLLYLDARAGPLDRIPLLLVGISCSLILYIRGIHLPLFAFVAVSALVAPLRGSSTAERLSRGLYQGLVVGAIVEVPAYSPGRLGCPNGTERVFC